MEQVLEPPRFPRLEGCSPPNSPRGGFGSPVASTRVFNTWFWGRTAIVDFGGLGGGRTLSKGWGASCPTFWKGFPGRRGRPDPQNPHLPVGPQIADVCAGVLGHYFRPIYFVLFGGGAGPGQTQIYTGVCEIALVRNPRVSKGLGPRTAPNHTNLYGLVASTASTYELEGYGGAIMSRAPAFLERRSGHCAWISGPHEKVQAFEAESG